MRRLAERIWPLPPQLKHLLALGAAAHCIWLVGTVAKWVGVATWDLGSIIGPTRSYSTHLALTMSFGTIAVAAGTYGLHGLLSDHWQRLKRALGRVAVRYWLLASSLVALVAAVAIRIEILSFAALADDEAAYLFSADVLRTGKLYASAPPDPLFWERAFLIIDGDKWYSQYFLGWPALLALFRAIDLHDIANAFFFALTIPFFFHATFEATRSKYAAYTGSLLLLSSPMLLIGSATLLSHASCLLLLTVLLWLIAREPSGARQRAARAAAVAVVFCAAFFVRPQTVLGLGGGLLVFWLASLWPWKKRRVEALCFALPAALGAAAFLYVNQQQTGDALVPAYNRLLDVLASKDFRFGHVVPNYDITKADLQYDVLRGFTLVPIGLWRFAFATFGLPLLLVVIPLARGRWAWAAWISIAGFYSLQWFANTAGIDSFGPVHLYELVLPVCLLVGIGLDAAKKKHGNVVTSLFVACVFVSFFTYTLSRLDNTHNVADGANDTHSRIQSFLLREGIERAVMFSAGSHASFCSSYPARHFVFWPPANPPDLDGPLLWANHLTTERDRELMATRFPTHQGFIYFWQKCELRIVPLDSVDARRVPDAPEVTPGPDWFR